MGWVRGSSLADEVWEKVKEYIPEFQKQDIAYEIYELFCDEDADWDGSTELEQDAGVNQLDEEELADDSGLSEEEYFD